jgi:DNA-3-methyladenine glycosylase I
VEELVKSMPKIKSRCSWANNNPLMIIYHDLEWGRVMHDDRLLFEFLILEGAQAGLSWQTVLNKRENYRKVFDNFDAKKIARYSKTKQETLLKNPGIIRNRLKVASVVINAQKFLEIQKEFGSFDRFIWQFVGGKPIKHKIKSIKEIPTTSNESDAMSKELKRRGFKFVGSTICYAFMQAVGMIDDHEQACFRA